MGEVSESTEDFEVERVLLEDLVTDSSTSGEDLLFVFVFFFTGEGVASEADLSTAAFLFLEYILGAISPPAVSKLVEWRPQPWPRHQLFLNFSV